jgi:hypothetical protein
MAEHIEEDELWTNEPQNLSECTTTPFPFVIHISKEFTIVLFRLYPQFVPDLIVQQ